MWNLQWEQLHENKYGHKISEEDWGYYYKKGKRFLRRVNPDFQMMRLWPSKAGKDSGFALEALRECAELFNSEAVRQNWGI